MVVRLTATGLAAALINLLAMLSSLASSSMALLAISIKKPPAIIALSMKRFDYEAAACSPYRRSIVSAILGSVFSPHEARALKPRNEALCDTGLFDNFLEYRCTPIGDIQDEGINKGLSDEELVATDSLLAKLNAGATNTTVSTVSSSNDIDD